MPTMYRAMFPDGDHPKTGPSKNTLGAKIGHGKYDDLPMDEDGKVAPGTGGLSVAPRWRELPSHRIPERLNWKLRKKKARGDNRLVCWRHGTGDFETSAVTSQLQFVVQSSEHGVVEPRSRMSADEYQRALAATAPDWNIDED